MNNEQKNKTMFYGRARRIQFAKKVGIVLGIVLVLILIVSYINKKVDFTDHNVNFAYMRQYFNNRGFTCEQIENDGGKCFLKGDSIHYTFTRYSVGFEYLVKADAYSLQFRHIANTYDDITFITNNNSLTGTKNKKYFCYTKENDFKEFDYCETTEGEKLEAEPYVGIIRTAIIDLNDIINSSGYDRDILMNEYLWQKK